MLVQQKDKWEEQEGRGRKEKEELNQHIQKNRLLQQENLQLKSEVDRYCMCAHPQTVRHLHHLRFMHSVCAVWPSCRTTFFVSLNIHLFTSCVLTWFLFLCLD